MVMPVPNFLLERWAKHLHHLNLSFVYKSGKDNPADFLPHHPTFETISKHLIMIDMNVILLACSKVPKAMIMLQVQTATNADKVLQSLRAVICCSMWGSNLVEPDKNIKEEVTVTMQNAICTPGFPHCNI